MRIIFITIGLIISTNVCFAYQGVSVPEVVISQTQQTIVIQPQPVVISKPLVKTIEWVLVPNVNSIIVPEIRRGIWGRQYIVNKNELVTTWVWTPVEVYR
jgi:hypothetical protein